MAEVTIELLERVLTRLHPSWTEEMAKEKAAKSIHIWQKDSKETEAAKNQPQTNEKV